MINIREDLVNVCDQDGQGLGIQVVKMDAAEIVIGCAKMRAGQCVWADLLNHQAEMTGVSI